MLGAVGLLYLSGNLLYKRTSLKFPLKFSSGRGIGGHLSIDIFKLHNWAVKSRSQESNSKVFSDYFYNFSPVQLICAAFLMLGCLMMCLENFLFSKCEMLTGGKDVLYFMGS